MAILLIRPRGPAFYHVSGPDQGLGFLVAALRRAGLEVTVLDLTRRPIRELRATLRRKQFSQIGVKLFSHEVRDLRQIADVIGAEQSSSLPIVAGGPLPTGLAGDVFDQLPQLRFAMRGEAEVGYPRLAALLENGTFNEAALHDIPSLTYRIGDSVHVNPQSFPPDLDALGFPDYTDMPPRGYPPEYASGEPAFPVTTSRGCPYACAYCAATVMNGRTLRKHSADYVLDLFQFHRDHNNIRLFSIVDDNFTADAEHARTILEGILSRNLDIRWRAPNGLRLDTLNLDMVKLIERAGCTELYLGIESGSNRVLADMNRRTTVDRYREKVSLLARHTKIRLCGLFIMGYPTERREDALQTIDFSCELPIQRAAFSFFTPHPGSAIFAELQKRGELIGGKWDSFCYDAPTFGTRFLTRGEVRRLQRLANFRFYRRPRILLGLAANIKSPRQLVRLVRRIVAVMFPRNGPPGTEDTV